MMFSSHIRGNHTVWNFLEFAPFFFVPCCSYTAVCSAFSHQQITLLLFPIWGFYKSNKYKHSHEAFWVLCLTEIPEAQGLGCLVVGHLVILRDCFILCHFIRDSLSCLLLLLWYILAILVRRHCWLTVDVVFILAMNSDIEYLLVYSFVKCLFIFYPCFHWIVFYGSGFESIRY